MQYSIILFIGSSITMIVYECMCTIYFDYRQVNKQILVDAVRIFRFTTNKLIKQSDMNVVIVECLEEFYGLKNDFHVDYIKMKNNDDLWKYIQEKKKFITTDTISIHEIPNEMIRRILKQIQNEQ